MSKQEFKYKSTFAFNINKVAGNEIDKLVSLAGLENLRNLLPANVDLKEHPDLIGVCGNICVAGLRNLNGDAISLETGREIANKFKWKYIDSNHSRSRLVGVIANVGFSQFGVNKMMDDKEMMECSEPYNIACAGLLYAAVLPKEFIELLENSADETSADYNKLSFSWELIFDSYDIAVGPKEVSKAKIVPHEEHEKYHEYLMASGGKGRMGDDYVYRVIKGPWLIPAGIGIVEHPAGNVKGIDIISANKTETTNSSANIEINVDLQKNQETSQNSCVTINELEKNNVIMDKFTSKEQITDETLKVAKASAIHSFIEEELKKASENFVSEKTKFDTEIEKAKKEHADLIAEYNKVKASLENIEKELNTLKEAAAAREADERFNQRMTLLDDKFNLDDDDRKLIAEDVKNLDTDSFASYEKRMTILMKGKLKSNKTSNASVNTENKQETVDKALENADKDKGKLPNTTNAGEGSLRAKYAKAFSEDGWELDTRGLKK